MCVVVIRGLATTTRMSSQLKVDDFSQATLSESDIKSFIQSVKNVNNNQDFENRNQILTKELEEHKRKNTELKQRIMLLEGQNELLLKTQDEAIRDAQYRVKDAQHACKRLKREQDAVLGRADSATCIICGQRAATHGRCRSQCETHKSTDRMFCMACVPTACLTETRQCRCGEQVEMDFEQILEDAMLTAPQTKEEVQHDLFSESTSQ